LNRAGDARRASARLPDDVDVRLALAWAELVATDGDPQAGARIVRDTAGDPELARSPERRAMHRALAAIVAARNGQADLVRATHRRKCHAREQRDAEPLGDHLLRGLHVVELDDALGYDTGLPHERARELVVAGRAVEQDEVVLRQLLEPDTAAARERMVSADDEQQLVVEQRNELGLRMADGPADAELH